MTLVNFNLEVPRDRIAMHERTRSRMLWELSSLSLTPEDAKLLIAKIEESTIKEEKKEQENV